MVLGNENHDLDAPELTQQEINDEFDFWFEIATEPTEYYWEVFLEYWSELELLTWLRNDTLKGEFKKFYVENLCEGFKEATNEIVNYDYVSNKIGEI